MASVNFMKVKDRAYLRGLLRHCDKELREQTRHSNKHIDTAYTQYNLQTDDYAAAYERFTERIDYLDSLPGANKRKDRVECFALEIPIPSMMTLMDAETVTGWVDDVHDLLRERFGDDNLVAGYTHVDEIHEYRDARTGETESSRIHLHEFYVPAVGDKLCGKDFSSKKAMKALNKAIDDMTWEKYGMRFLTGREAKGGMDYGRSVEDLKVESEIVQGIIDEDTGELSRRRKRADKDADKVRQQAEQDAQAIREAAERDAQKILQDAQAQAEAAREVVRQKIRAEVDEAKKERDEAVKARRASQAALQGDYRAWAADTSRPTAKRLLGVLGAAVEASRTPPASPGISSAYERMMRIVTSKRDAKPGPTAVEGPTR